MRTKHIVKKGLPEINSGTACTTDYSADIEVRDYKSDSVEVTINAMCMRAADLREAAKFLKSLAEALELRGA